MPLPSALVLLGFVLSLAASSDEGLSARGAKVYALPAGVKPEFILPMMLKSLGLENSMDVPGAAGEKVLPEVKVLRDGAGMRLEPEGGISKSWHEGEPVLVVRKKDAWRQIYNRAGSYAWTLEKKLIGLPIGKILLDASSDLAKRYPQALLDFPLTKEEAIVFKLTALVQGHDKVALKRAQAELCPRDFTEAERDGLFSDAGGALGGVESSREVMLRLCDSSYSREQARAVLKKVSLKNEMCDCLHSRMGDLLGIGISWKSFPPKSSQGEYECTKGRFHVFCRVMESCGEGCGPGVIACPFGCLDFQ